MIIKANESINEPITVGTTVRNKHVTITGINTLWGKCDIKSLERNEQVKVSFKYHGILTSGIYFITPAVALADNNSNEIERFDRFEDELILNIKSKMKFEGFVNLSDGIIIGSENN